MFSNTLNMQDQVSHPYSATIKIIVLYTGVLIFTFSHCRQGDNKFLSAL
jgi:hypothetical protein